MDNSIKKIMLSDISKENINIDLFVCFSSFEERCLSISKYINRERIKESIIFYNEDNIDYVGNNLKRLESFYGEKARRVPVMHCNPLRTADMMINTFKKKSISDSVGCVFLDTTSFTHEALLIVLKIIPLFFPKATLICGYANADDYDSNNTSNEKWLSKGISEIRSVLGYPGDFLPAQKTHLILIAGYEYERAYSIINCVEPSSISLGFGQSNNATAQKNMDANEHYAHLVEQMATNYCMNKIEKFEVKCNDPFVTCEKVTEQILKYKDKNIMIVPLNNKISTIGVALATSKYDGVQLCYAPALAYNYEHYSLPGNHCYLFKIPNNVEEN